MKFTNDIKFNKKPMSNRLLKITYSGELYKNNSSEVSIIYGFGENWENTKEQKMYKTSYGFCYTLLIENYNTFNFCFKNEQNIWDNNNNFNYIAPIEISNNYSTISQVPNQEANKIVNENIDNIINSINIDFSNTKNVQTIEAKEDSILLDSLVNDLFEEYGYKEPKENIKEISKAPSLSNNENEIHEEFIKIEEKLDTETEKNKALEEESFKEMSKMFNDLISEIQTDKQEKIDEAQTINQEKNTEVQTIKQEEITEVQTINQDKIEEAQTINQEKNTEVQTIKQEEITEVQTINQAKIVDAPENKNSKLDVGTEIEALFNNTFTENFVSPKNTNEDYTPLYDDVILENDENTSDINSTEENNSNANITQENNSNINIENEKIEQNIFNFENLDFDFSIPETSTIIAKPRDFSDSFYDDQDISTHDYLDFEKIVDSTITEINKETATANEAFDEEFKKQSEEFDKAVSEYSEYFDSLIEEIISSPTTSLSKSVSNEEVFEKEQNQLVEAQTEDYAIPNIMPSTTDVSSDGVPEEYALYNYKSYSFLYMIKRRFKMLISTVFNKLPKIFGRQPNIDEK